MFFSKILTMIFSREITMFCQNDDPKHISNQDKDVGLFSTILTIQKSKFTQTYDAFKKALQKNHH